MRLLCIIFVACRELRASGVVGGHGSFLSCTPHGRGAVVRKGPKNVSLTVSLDEASGRRWMGQHFPLHFATWSSKGQKRLRACRADPGGRTEGAEQEAGPLPAQGEQQLGDAFPAWGQLHLLYLGSVSSRQCLCGIHPGDSWELPPTSSPPNGSQWLFTLMASVSALGLG